MSHRMYLEVWIMLYRGDIKKVEIIMPTLAFLTEANYR